MNRLQTIDLGDRGAAQEIVAAAYMDLRNAPVDMKYSRPEAIGRAGMCIEASDAVTRAAHKLGIFAARETHNNHCMTAFNPLDTLPGEDDPIICITWGQFNEPAYSAHLAAGHEPAFFGKRKDMAELITSRDYERNYSANSVWYRQIAYAPRGGGSPLREWLCTMPHDLVKSSYPVGEVDPSTIPDGEWSIF